MVWHPTGKCAKRSVPKCVSALCIILNCRWNSCSYTCATTGERAPIVSQAAVQEWALALPPFFEYIVFYGLITGSKWKKFCVVSPQQTSDCIWWHIVHTLSAIYKLVGGKIRQTFARQRSDKAYWFTILGLGQMSGLGRRLWSWDHSLSGLWLTHFAALDPFVRTLV
jgi:hypothetical protein